LVAVNGADQLLRVRRWGFESCQLSCHLVHRQDLIVPFPLIVAHGVVEGPVTLEHLIEPAGAHFGIAECVADALRRNEILGS